MCCLRTPGKDQKVWDVCVLSTWNGLPLHLLEGGCRPETSHCCPKKCGGCGCSALKQVDRPGWWKEGKFALFQTPAGRGEDAGHLSKGRLTAPPPKAFLATSGARAFPDRSAQGLLYAETAPSAAIFSQENTGKEHYLRLVAWLNKVKTIFLLLSSLYIDCPSQHVTVFQHKLQFQGKQWQLIAWVQSGHHTVNISTCSFGIYNVAHRL